MENTITTIAELKNKKYVVVDLDGWDGDDVFTVKLQRVDILILASKCKIPNPLMSVVIELFKGKSQQAETEEENLKMFNEVAELFCEATMVEPTFAEVKEVIELTDVQKMAIYNFALGGVRALEPFRKKQENNQYSEHGDEVQ